jgi:hypothetical protein
MLLDNEMIEVQDFNSRVQQILQRAKEEQQVSSSSSFFVFPLVSVSPSTLSQTAPKRSAGTEQLEEFARALDVSTVPKQSVRRTTSDDDMLMKVWRFVCAVCVDPALSPLPPQEIGLPPATKGKGADTLPKRTVHDEGTDELDDLLKDL